MKGYGLRYIVGGGLAMSALALTGCGDQEGWGADAPGDPGNVPAAAVPMREAVQDLVNQGNAAQREARYGDALVLYQEAMDAEPEHPVPQFGALMAALALGDTELAESLKEGLAVSAPELLAMLSPDGGMGDQAADPHAGVSGMPPGLPGADIPAQGGLPPGHPVLGEVRPDTTPPDTTG